jgi:hypothetical protein
VTFKRVLIDSAAAILSPPVTRYIVVQRKRLEPRSFALTETEKQGVRGYFSDTELDRFRIHVSDPLPIGELPLSGVLGSISQAWRSSLQSLSIT